MPAVIFFACLDLEQKYLIYELDTQIIHFELKDGHYLRITRLPLSLNVIGELTRYADIRVEGERKPHS
jgi:hypothetical protein